MLRVVLAAGTRANPFFDVLVDRLLTACGGRSDVVRHVNTPLRWWIRAGLTHLLFDLCAVVAPGRNDSPLRGDLVK
jgi:hypothetical protein